MVTLTNHSQSSCLILNVCSKVKDSSWEWPYPFGAGVARSGGDKLNIIEELIGNNVIIPTHDHQKWSLV